jgi:hypothetical protein
MSVIKALSSSLGQKGNEANIALAKEIAETENRDAIKELVDNLNNKDKKIQGDCIKTLYETAYIKPEMIVEYYLNFLDLLTSKNNRMIWSGMIALLTITDLKYKEIFSSLELIMTTIEKGSVITIDCGVEILAKLNKHSKYFDITDPLLIEQLWKCPIKQLPQYMEKSLISITKQNKEIYQNIIEKRKHECDKDSQKKRLEKVLKQINKL